MLGPFFTIGIPDVIDILVVAVLLYTATAFLKQTRAAFIIRGIFIIAAVVTPPDVVSQLILALPLMLLFEGSLLLMRKTEDGDGETEEGRPEALPAPAPASGEAAAAPPPAAGS